MAAGDNEVNVKFGATIDDFKSKMGEVQNIFKAVVERFGALAAVVAGGAAFKAVIGETNTLNSEAMKLSKTLGITGEDAGTLNTALGDIGSDADTYTGAFLKFNRALRTNSEGMQALGVDVAGLKSGQKDSNQVFMEAIQIVAKYKPGIDQTQVAMQLFGRSVDDVQKLLRLNSEKLEEAKKKNQELNLVITEEGVAASKKYKEAMNDVQDVLKGLEKTVGEAVIPIFTESALKLAAIGPALVEGMKAAVTVFVEIWRDIQSTVGEVLGDIGDGLMAVLGGLREVFGGEGLTAMQLFRNALAVIQIAWIGFRVAFQEVVNGVKVGLQLMGAGMVSFAAVAERALHLDFAGAKAEFQAGVDERNRILTEGMAKAVAIAQKGADDMDKAAMKPLSAPKEGTPKGAPAGGTKTANIGKDKGSGEKLAAELALKKAQNEAELNLQQEYLKQDEAINDDAFKNNLESIRDYYNEKEAIELSRNQLSLNTKRKELQDAADAEKAAQAKSGSAATSQDKAKYDTQALKFKTEQVKLQGEINVLEAQGVEASRAIAAARADAERQLADQLTTIATNRAKASADNEIATETAVLEQKKALRQIDAEDAFAVQKQIEEKSYAATLEQLQAKRAAIHGDQANAVKERAQLDADAEAAEQQHQQKLSAIDRAAELERSKYSIQAQQSVQSGFSTMVNDLLSGTKKISDVFRQFGVSVANTFTNLIAQKFTDKLFDATGVNKAIDKMVSFVTSGIQKMVAKWIGGEAANTAAATTGAANRTAVATGESTAAITTTGTETAAVVTAEGTKTAAKTAATTTAAALDTTAAATAVTTQQTTTIAAVLGYAAEAAVAAMASVAAIPFVGWAMAPEVGAATYAMGLSYLASAAGGWDEIPNDQIAQVHKKEMILSAPLAQGLRDLVGDGGITPLTNTVNQIVNNLAPNAPARDDKPGALDPKAPQPADGATSTVPKQPAADAPVKAAAPLEDQIKPLAPEHRPVPADASISIAMSAPAPQGRSAPPAEAAPEASPVAPEPPRSNAPAGAALPLPAQVPAVATAAPVASTANGPASAAAIVARWLGNDSTNTAAPATSMAPGADTPMAQKTWWQVPASPLAQIQSAATQTPGSATAAQKAPVSGDTYHFNLSAIDGKSAKQFLLDNGQHIATAVQQQVRNGRPIKS